jgi:hypothetical protein
MSPHRFDLFTQTIDHVPVKAIVDAVKLEHGVIEEDLLYKRVPETKEVDSILHFCKFIIAAIEGDNVVPCQLPVRHVAYYREVVLRLIRAGELPDATLERFDRVCFSNVLQRMTCQFVSKLGVLLVQLCFSESLILTSDW